MARKVFLSLLGSTDYKECTYFDSDFTSSKTRFIQIAMCEKYVKNWSEVDVAYIFLTSGDKGSYKKNWLDNGHTKLGTTEPIMTQGLKGLITSIKLPCKVLPVNIENGDNEEDIWKNFRIIFDCLQSEDEVYFDVTHGFRSLPILVMVLNNYSKFLKSITVKSITYGNYEARNATNEAPIINLTPLSLLQDWTIAANEFINFGNADRIKKLTDLNITPILKETKGQNQNAKNLKSLAKNLSDLSEDIKTNRGKAIIAGKTATNIVNALAVLEQNIIAPLNPIIEKIKNSISNFNQQEDAKNMLYAVKWCLEKNLVQEGFTLLQEGILSSLLLSDDYEDEKKRNFISGYLNQYKTGKFENTRFNLPIPEVLKLEKLLSEIPKITEWADIFSQITEIRNDINHAGIRQNPLKAKDFQSKLDVLYMKTNQLLSSSSC